jgi:HEAT repeat protein
MHLLELVQITGTTFTVLSLLLLAGVVIVRADYSRRISEQKEFRKTAMPHLCAYLAGQEGREAVLGILGRKRFTALDLLMDQSEEMDLEARKKLAPLYSGLSYTEGIIRDLESHYWPRRLRAAERLGYLGEESAIPPLMRALGDDILDVRLAAALSLARLECGGALIPIIRSLDLPGEISQRRIAEILAVMGDEAAEPLLKILQDRTLGSAALCIAIRTSTLLNLHRAAPVIGTLLDHTDENVRINAVRALGSLGETSCIQEITALAEDSSWAVRNAVMDALGRLNDKKSIPLLTESLGDREWWVRYHAGIALWKLGAPGIEALRKSTTDHVDAYGRDMGCQILQQKGILNTVEVPA